MRERESMRMKNFIFKSSDNNNSDLQKFSRTLETIQKQLRDLRDDNQTMTIKLNTCVKALAAIYSSPKDETEDSEKPWQED